MTRAFLITVLLAWFISAAVALWIMLRAWLEQCDCRVENCNHVREAMK